MIGLDQPLARFQAQIIERFDVVRVAHTGERLDAPLVQAAGRQLAHPGARRWAKPVDTRGGWRGHLFDGRHASVAMDEDHLMAAIRHVALNPVRARLAARAEDWP
jgi:putative transposase